jgi:hypothetical protein
MELSSSGPLGTITIYPQAEQNAKETNCTNH